MDRKELVAEWLRFAFMDFDNAKYLFETRQPAPLEIVCYHCQQSAEKYLKSVIIAFGEEPEKTHDLLKLTGTLQNHTEVSEEILDFAERLTMYGVRVRYPDEIPVAESQTKTAITHAEKIKQWSESEIAKIEKAEKENQQK